jgi:hypothetical protein
MMKYSTNVGGEQASPLVVKMKDTASCEAFTGGTS